MAKLSVWAFLALLIPVKFLLADESCIRYDKPGTCARISECKPLLEEIKNAGSPMPIRIRFKLHDLSCNRFDSGEPVICCLPSSGTSNPVTTEPITRDKPTPTTDGTITESRLGEAPVDVQHHPNLQLLPTDCGVFDSDRLYGGNLTRLYEMPWMVLLAFDTPRGRKLSCAGTLISEWYVLTAAHCVTFLGEGTTLKAVVLGEHDIRKDPDCERIEHQKFCAPNIRNASIDTVVAHKGYNDKNFTDDIALVRLSEPADFRLETMQPICLPITPKLQNEDLVGRGGIVAGWGATETGLQSPVLLSVELPIVGKEECQKVHKEIAIITDRKLCAGGIEDYDSCSGDSGGPLMYPGNVGDTASRYVQRGIVSYGARRCGRAGFPGVYTKVSHYMDWILDNMRQ